MERLIDKMTKLEKIDGKEGKESTALIELLKAVGVAGAIVGGASALELLFSYNNAPSAHRTYSENPKGLDFCYMEDYRIDLTTSDVGCRYMVMVGKDSSYRIVVPKRNSGAESGSTGADLKNLGGGGGYYSK